MADGLSEQLAALKINREERNADRPRRGMRWVVFLVALGLLGLAGWVAVPRIQQRLQIVEVDLTRITSMSAADALVSVTATGYVQPLRVAFLGAETQTRITEVNVAEGQPVSAGDVLFVFDSSDYEAVITAAEARVRAAQARVEIAETSVEATRVQLERARRMADRGAGAAAEADDLDLRLDVQDAEVDAGEAEVRALRAEVASLEEGRDRFVVVAPFDGIVINNPAERGAVVDPTRALVELMDPASLVVEADIPEGRMAAVEVGAPCEVVFDAYPEGRFEGAVVGFAPRMDRARATATARIRVEAPPALMPEMAARVRFLREVLPADQDAEPRVVVPATALAEVGGSQVVFVFEAPTVRQVPVTLGEALGDGYVLLEGPAAGTPVVQRPPPELRGGATVREREL